MKRKISIPVLLFDTIPPFVRLLRSHVKTATAGSMTFPQFRVLAQVKRGVNTVSDIAEQIGVSQPAMTKMAGGLIERGYLRRDRDLSDGRQYNLKLTKKGETLYDETIAKAERSLEQHFSSLSIEKKRELLDLLKQLREFTNVENP